MRERVSEYTAQLTVKGKSGYELAARVCSSYFDGRGIDYPAASDWDAFKEYYRQEYQREKGKALSETTLQQNFVARGKAFYRWCMEQDTPPLIETENRPQAPQTAINADTQTSTAGDEAEKTVRVNFLMKQSRYEFIAVLSVFAGKSMTDILTEAVDLYVREHAEEAETIRAMGNKLRGKA